MRILKKSNQIYVMYIRSISNLSHINRNYSSCSTNMKLLIESRYLTAQGSDTFFHKWTNSTNCQNVRNICLNHALYLKQGGKVVSKGSVAKIKLDLREMGNFIDIDKLSNEFKKHLEKMRSDFVQNLSLRSATGSIEDIIVTFEDNEYRLQELVQVARKPNFVIINAVAFPQAIPQILEAISKSGMNLNPQQDGTKISVPIPKVTKEHREILSKNAKAIFIKCRDNIKDVRNKHLKKLDDDDALDVNVHKRIKKNLDILCEQHILEAENLLKSKQAELLKS